MQAQATQFSMLIHSHTSLKKEQVDLPKAKVAAHDYATSGGGQLAGQATQFSTLIHSHTSLKKGQVDPAKAEAAAQDYATSVGGHFLQQLFSTNTKGLFGGGQTEVMFRSIFMKEISASMGDIFGIAKAVYPILLKNQEKTNGK
ncbi:MAG: hypothetical protein K0M45_05455 [Candidatus Paracaedibacteraceae bacterium]|nr:hypothetical protein [Candidatus Paracaedibacteraceae bacterium]